MRAVGAVVLAAVVVLSLTGCFGPDESIAIEQAEADFQHLVDEASAVDVAVLHTLEVEAPATEPCKADTDDRHTAYVAAGTVAVGATETDERDLLTGFESSFDEERWVPVERTELPGTRRAYVDADGITSTITVEDGLLVIAVFSPCRG